MRIVDLMFKQLSAAKVLKIEVVLPKEMLREFLKEK